MRDASNFYFQSFNEWREAITIRCNIKLTKEYVHSRINALQDSSDKTTQEFKAQYGEDYLNQVIDWFKQAEPK